MNDVLHVESERAYEVLALKEAIQHNMEHRLAKHLHGSTRYDRFLSVAYSVFEHTIAHWIDTQERYRTLMPRRVYYLSMEWLLGRLLENALIASDLEDEFQEAMNELGISSSEVLEAESDAGLGNGGLGRLAACFLDSMATLGIPAIGYGLRYEYGLFRQRIVDGRQQEVPDRWLALPNPWEVMRPEYIIDIQFGGHVTHQTAADGSSRARWEGGEVEQAIAYDIPVPGYRTETVNTLRLWSAQSPDEFNLEYFNHGDYIRACEEQVEAENLTRILYPNDNIFQGKELRLKQEYFLVASSIQDILMRFFREWGRWRLLPEKVAIQLNDTHPALAIPELMRVLLDKEGMDWETAWDITVGTFAYTNHTILPEAMEVWPVSFFERLLPRHLEIVYEINHHFLKDVARRYPGDTERLRRMSLINEDGVKSVRMAHLAVVGSHSINGVSALHSRILRDKMLADFAEIWPERFNNKTNGITPRRWLRQANPPLASLITGAIGEEWVRNADELQRLETLADDAGFREAWQHARMECKHRLIQQCEREHRIVMPAEALFDVQVKRMHEYKRQLLFALYIMALYLRVKEDPGRPFVPRVCLVGGKAAPGYDRAKLMIQLINRIAGLVNDDARVNDLLRVHFLPDYRVSLAERLIPATDLSEQISMAGMEASGTGNMKFMMNGALTIGTLDGANIEMAERVGDDNIFIFGHTADEIQELKRQGYAREDYIARSPELQAALHLLSTDFFCPGEPGLFQPLYRELCDVDYYCILADFEAYLACQDRVTAAYQDLDCWTRMSILNTARSGFFSSDRTIREYARDIWRVPVAEETADDVVLQASGC